MPLLSAAKVEKLFNSKIAAGGKIVNGTQRAQVSINILRHLLAFILHNKSRVRERYDVVEEAKLVVDRTEIFEVLFAAYTNAGAGADTASYDRMKRKSVDSMPEQ